MLSYGATIKWVFKSIKEMTSLEAVLLQQYSNLFFWLKTSCLSFLIAVAEEELPILFAALKYGEQHWKVSYFPTSPQHLFHGDRRQSQVKGAQRVF